jgi:aldoxime dehydratase
LRAIRAGSSSSFFTAKGQLEGVSILLGGFSEPIIEHGYWGSMRDRLPLSQNDTMEPSGEPTLTSGKPGGWRPRPD